MIRDGTRLNADRRKLTAPMQATRRRLLQTLWSAGPLGVDELAGLLGLSPMTVRHHLGVLERQGLLAATAQQQPGRPGRPRLSFQLTPAGAETFPSNALLLADWLVDEMKVELGCGRLESMLCRIAERAAAEFTPATPVSTSRRLDQMVTFLNNRGYQAGWKIDDDAAGRYLLWTGPCPYRWVVRRHPELCALDQALLARLSGGVVERLPGEQAQFGADCVYRLHWPLARTQPASG
jgi:predicted ArsR family transcriptional regulator